MSTDLAGKKIVVTGSTGLIGSALCATLAESGADVLKLVRRAPESDAEARWDPAKGELAEEALLGAWAVINLAGQSIAEDKWTARVKREILESRVNGTRLLAEACAALSEPPSVLLNASAIGCYGERGEEALNEDSTWATTGFQAEVVRAWEAATQPAAAAGIRVALPRFGVVLAEHGGALGRMLGPFKLGGGGSLGSGRQWYSWISLTDATRALCFILATDSLAGPINLTSPQPVRNADFAQELAGLLNRPALVNMPAAMIRMLFGEMGESLLLSSTKVLPSRLLAAGFEFYHPTLATALRHELKL